jgi:hypothetical protein
MTGAVDRESGGEDEAACGRGTCAHFAAVDLHALADTDEAVAESVGRHRSGAVVEDLELELVWAIPEGHIGVARTRMLEGVGQALLHDSVGGEVDRARKRERFAVDV